MSQWYYVDQAGGTVGPVSEEVLASTYTDGKITDNSYVWNGTTVNEWLIIGDVPGLSEKLKPAPKPAPKPKPAAVKPQPVAAQPKPQVSKSNSAAGQANMERSNLLAAIRAGKKLKKQPKKEVVKKKPVAQMSLAEQMKEKLSKRNQNQPARSGSRKKIKSVTKTKPKVNVDKFGRGDSSSAGVLPYKLKNKIANIRDALDKLSAEDEWKILAIEKILN